MKLKVFFLIALNASVLHSFAQKNFHLKSRTALPSTTRNVTSSFINKKTGDYIRVFELQGITKKIAKGQFAGMDFVERQVGFILPRGNEYMFEPNEQLVSESNGYVLTLQLNFEGDSRRVTSYQQISGSLTRVASKTVNSIEGSDYLLDNGSVIITDESEGFGTYIQVLSSDLRIINNIQPFPSGYSDNLVTSDGNTIVSVVRNENITKLLLINASTGHVQRDAIIAYTDALQKVYAQADKILIYGSQYLTCFNFKADLLWRIKLVSPYFDFFLKDGKVFAFTTTGLTSLNLNTGKADWELDFPAMIQSKTNTSSIPWPLSFDVSQDGVATAILTTRSRSTPTQETSNGTDTIILVSRQGKLLEKFNIQSRGTGSQIRNLSNSLQVIQNNEVLTYEKLP